MTAPIPTAVHPQLGFPAVDYHIHLSDDLSLEQAVALADERQITIGIVEHPGREGGIENDADLNAYVARLRAQPVYAGLQPMYLGWSEAFSPAALASLDYVLMDADSVPWDGGYLYLWLHDLLIEDMDLFVARYVAHIHRILSAEPIDIFARPTFLPIPFARHYDEIWTPDRMRAIIDLALARDIALEIAENVRVPSLAFIRMAKDAGAKFTLGTNGRNRHNAGHLHYGVEMAIKAGLTADDMRWF